MENVKHNLDFLYVKSNWAALFYEKMYLLFIYAFKYNLKKFTQYHYETQSQNFVWTSSGLLGLKFYFRHCTFQHMQYYITYPELKSPFNFFRVLSRGIDKKSSGKDRY